VRHLVSKTIWQHFTRIYFVSELNGAILEIHAHILVSELNGAILEKTFHGPWVTAFHLR